MPLTKPAAQRHLEKARSNYALYSRLKSEVSHLDWAVTVLFYTALHLVQSQFVETAATGFDIPRDHPERDNAVARLFPRIYTLYRFLSTRSQWARYFSDKPSPSPDQLQGYEDSHFAPIAAELSTLDIVI